jgi:putative SOS response-associated peptidase YedK
MRTLCRAKRLIIVLREENPVKNVEFTGLPRRANALLAMTRFYHWPDAETPEVNQVVQHDRMVMVLTILIY